MSRRGRPDRERFEVLLLHLLLSRRPIWFGAGVILLIYGVAAMAQYPFTAFAALVLGAYAFTLVYSYRMVLFTARFGAWLGTLWKRENR